MNKWMRSILVGVASGGGVWLLVEIDVCSALSEHFTTINEIAIYAIPVLILFLLMLTLSADALSVLAIKVATTTATSLLLILYIDWTSWLYAGRELSNVDGLIAVISLMYCAIAFLIGIIISFVITLVKVIKNKRD